MMLMMHKPAFPLFIETLCDLAPLNKDVEIPFCWRRRRKVGGSYCHRTCLGLKKEMQADKRFFLMLKKHFDSVVVMDDREEEREAIESGRSQLDTAYEEKRGICPESCTVIAARKWQS